MNKALGIIYTFLGSIINVTYLDNRSESERVRIRMLNIISLLSWSFTWTYGVIHLFLGKFYPSAITFSLGTVYLFIVYLNHKKHTLISKVLHTFNSNLGIYSFSCFLGLASGVHLYVLLAPLFVLSLFSFADLKWILFCILIYVINYWVMMYAPAPVIFEQMIIPAHMVIIFYHVNVFFTLIMLGSIMAFVLNLNSNYINAILAQNEILVANEKELKEEIAKRKESESNLRKLFDDLSQSYKNLEQFSFVVSHNMRAPLANILGFANFYDRNEGGLKSNHEIVDSIEQSAKNFDEILTDLNVILKSKNSSSEKKEEMKFLDILNSTTNSLKQEISNNDVEIRYNFDENQTIITSRVIIRSILYNLLSNAIKYRNSEIRSEIDIYLRNQDEKYLLEIKDNGIGIDLEKYSDRLFKLYTRFNKNVQGKGIGLYLVKVHVESLGGTIDVKSKLGEGTSFIISI